MLITGTNKAAGLSRQAGWVNRCAQFNCQYFCGSVQENYISQQDMWNVPLISLFGEMSMEESESEFEIERD